MNSCYQPVYAIQFVIVQWTIYYCAWCNRIPRAICHPYPILNEFIIKRNFRINKIWPIGYKSWEEYIVTVKKISAISSFRYNQTACRIARWSTDVTERWGRVRLDRGKSIISQTALYNRNYQVTSLPLRSKGLWSPVYLYAVLQARWGKISVSWQGRCSVIKRIRFVKGILL